MFEVLQLLVLTFIYLDVLKMSKKICSQPLKEEEIPFYEVDAESESADVCCE